MTTIALEFVPPDLAHGSERAKETAQRVRELLRHEGIEGRINALLIPGMIPEEDDRPVPLRPKLDVLDVHREVSGVLRLESIVTQVTAFSSSAELDARMQELMRAGIRRTVFVGVPRTLADGAGPGLAPSAALELYRERLAGCGVILIPTRVDEAQRFSGKLRAGANFALTQMLFSDRIGEVLAAISPEQEPRELRPEILLSFAYVPRSEERVGLIRWLIRDTSAAAVEEMQTVQALAPLAFRPKRAALVEIFVRAAAAARARGFPLGLHFECPYDFNPYAIEVFHGMLDAWEREGGSPA